MGINQKLINNMFFLIFFVCSLTVASNISKLLKTGVYSNSVVAFAEQGISLNSWKEIADGQHVVEEFSNQQFYTLKEYINTVLDKRLVLFEVIRGRARVVFETV